MDTEDNKVGNSRPREAIVRKADGSVHKVDLDSGQETEVEYHPPESRATLPPYSERHPDTRGPQGSICNRRKNLMAKLAAGVPIKVAYKQVGYASEASARSAIVNLRKQLQDTFVEYGLTPDTFVRDYLLPLMNATETKFFSFEGKVTDERMVEALAIRSDMVKFFARIAGYMPRKEEEGPTRISISINNVVCDNEDTQ